ncbi:MAG: hypothetical protein ABI758_04255 [Candidatus Woesebacteria bacterium]
MQEKTPLSGRILWFFHERYIRNRKLSGTDTEISISQRVLKHLENDGLIGGFSKAWNTLNDLCEKSRDDDGESFWRTAMEREMAVCIIIIYGSYEFFLISAGIGLTLIDGEGDWKFVSSLEDFSEEKRL